MRFPKVHQLFFGAAQRFGDFRVYLFHQIGRLIMADHLKATEALVAMPLPDMIKGLGLAVAAANKELSAQDAGSGHVLTVHSAVIEINVAISVSNAESFTAGGTLGFNVFSVNASYARSFNFKEDASSKIRLELSVKPKPA
jgi:hypothetical protein